MFRLDYNLSCLTTWLVIWVANFSSFSPSLFSPQNKQTVEKHFIFPSNFIDVALDFPKQGRRMKMMQTPTEKRLFIFLGERQKKGKNGRKYVCEKFVQQCKPIHLDGVKQQNKFPLKYFEFFAESTSKRYAICKQIREDLSIAVWKERRKNLWKKSPQISFSFSTWKSHKLTYK